MLDAPCNGNTEGRKDDLDGQASAGIIPLGDGLARSSWRQDDKSCQDGVDDGCCARKRKCGAKNAES